MSIKMDRLANVLRVCETCKGLDERKRTAYPLLSDPNEVRARSEATKRSAPKPPLDNPIFNSIFLTQPP